uniref:Ferritin n=1 Tax=Sus scrofa TaxID=9823 RepID=A0A5G2QZD3_PIG
MTRTSSCSSHPRFRAAFPLALGPAPPALVITPPSQVRQNFHPECEAALNGHANLELHASYAYLLMELMSLQNRRGGRLCFRDIRKPDLEAWGAASGPCSAPCTWRSLRISTDGGGRCSMGPWKTKSVFPLQIMQGGRWSGAPHECWCLCIVKV